MQVSFSVLYQRLFISIQDASIGPYTKDEPETYVGKNVKIRQITGSINNHTDSETRDL